MALYAIAAAILKQNKTAHKKVRLKKLVSCALFLLFYILILLYLAGVVNDSPNRKPLKGFIKSIVIRGLRLLGIFGILIVQVVAINHFLCCWLFC